MASRILNATTSFFSCNAALCVYAGAFIASDYVHTLSNTTKLIAREKMDCTLEAMNDSCTPPNPPNGPFGNFAVVNTWVLESYGLFRETARCARLNKRHEDELRSMRAINKKARLDAQYFEDRAKRAEGQVRDALPLIVASGAAWARANTPPPTGEDSACAHILVAMAI